MLNLLGSTLVQAFDELLFDIAGHWTIPNDGSDQTLPVGPADVEYIAGGL